MKYPKYIDVDGFRLPPTFDPDTFRAASKYKAGEDDLIVATYPKCGTTWMLQIVLLILRQGHPFKDSEDYFASNPFMEMSSREELKNRKRPGCIKTHLPFDRINFSRVAKYIYVARHPADCLISFYHHVRYFPVYCFSDGSLNDFFELFIKGELDFGDYFHHVLSWYQHKDEPNILFTTYEAMKEDHRGAVLKVGKFLGHQYYEDLVADGGELLDKVVKYSSLEFMKKTTDSFWKEIFISSNSAEDQENVVIKKYNQLKEEAVKMGHSSVGSFVRKGVVGEGKSVLSEEQLNALNARMLEEFAGTGIMDLWEEK